MELQKEGTKQKAMEEGREWGRLNARDPRQLSKRRTGTSVGRGWEERETGGGEKRVDRDRD